ncbi:cystatin-like protein [Drosophila bipectinata]|uniref:cystatin-like protein n=1 Tax=Drosophila bipectinata TaxID=42026 RepID=UPI001C89EEDA|nr:cystatin-like protein [Drosophila bipectinata]
MHALKVILVLGLALAVAADEVPVLGGTRPLEGAELEEAKAGLNSSLEKLASGDGPSYKVVKVKSATTQVVAGTLQKFEVELSNGSDNKDCIVSIWSQPWEKENGTQLTVECKNEGKIEKTW